MSTPTIHDPRRSRPPFDVPSERRSQVDLVVTAVIALVVVVVASVVWFSGSASSSGLDEAPADQPAYGPSKTPPSTLSLAFRAPSAGHGAPLVTRGNLVTVQDGEVVALEAGTGAQAWRYAHAGVLCDAVFYAEHVVTAWNGADGCSDVTSIDGVKGTYNSTRQSAFPSGMTLVRDKDNVLALSPSRLEIWRNDLVRTVEYGHVDAPQEAGQQPRSGCTLSSASLNSERFAVSERCPGDASQRLTLSKTVPKDSRKPEEIASGVTGAERLEVLAVLKDGILAAREKSGAWTVELYSEPGTSRTVARLTSAPTVPVGTSTVGRGGGTVRWFDGASVHVFNVNSGDESWRMPATGPGIEWGQGSSSDQPEGHLLALIPTSKGISLVSTADGKVQKEYPQRLTPGTDETGGVVGLAQVGDILYVRQPGEILAYKAA